VFLPTALHAHPSHGLAGGGDWRTSGAFVGVTGRGEPLAAAAGQPYPYHSGFAGDRGQSSYRWTPTDALKEDFRFKSYGGFWGLQILAILLLHIAIQPQAYLFIPDSFIIHFQS
jgi:hypothetical protein